MASTSLQQKVACNVKFLAFKAHSIAVTLSSFLLKPIVRIENDLAEMVTR